MKNQTSLLESQNSRYPTNPANSPSGAPAATCGSLESGLRRFSAACLQKLHDIKERVASDLASDFAGILNRETVRQAVAEADSLAAMTPFPALFLPTLAEEKVRAASDWHARQSLIRKRTLPLATVAEPRPRRASRSSGRLQSEGSMVLAA